MLNVSELRTLIETNVTNLDKTIPDDLIVSTDDGFIFEYALINDDDHVLVFVTPKCIVHDDLENEFHTPAEYARFLRMMNCANDNNRIHVVH